MSMTTEDIIIICRREKSKLNKRKEKLPNPSIERTQLKDTMYVLHLAFKRLENLLNKD